MAHSSYSLNSRNATDLLLIVEMGFTTPPTRKPQPIRIELTGVGKRFNREWIFRDMNETFHPGQVYAITGPNGAGKSTLLSLLWGQTPPSLGGIRYQGETRT